MEQDSAGRRLEIVLLGLNLAVVIFLIVALVIAPIAIDQIHMDDTVFLANLGWRGVNGYRPVIDYPHFYGGLAEWFVTTAFRLFGVSYKVINYAFVMLFAAAASLGWLLCWKRLRAVELSLLAAIAASLILSLNPLEAYQNFTPGHSFVYNHVAIVLMLGLTVFACLELDDRRSEMISALAAGGVLYVLVLLKTPFGTFGLAVLLACLIQNRWRSAGLVVAGAVIVMLLLDPTMAKASGSLKLLLTSTAASDAGGVDGRIRVAWLMILTQTVPIAIVFVLAVVLWRRSRTESLLLLASLLICGAGYGAAMLSTGGSPQHKLLPFLALAALLMARRLAEARTANTSRVDAVLIGAVPIILAYLLVLPALATSAIALSRSFERREAVLVEQGPLATYAVFEPSEPYSAGPVAERLAEASSNTRRRIARRQTSERDEFVMFADGATLLHALGNAADFGIVSNGRMFDFTAPLGAKVVKSYPVWPTMQSPELISRSPLEADVDMVMMLDEIPQLELVSAALRTRMGQDFRPCRRSAFWTLFVRNSVTNVSCGLGNR